MKNKALSKYQIKKIIECFALELTSTQCSKLLKINRNTINKYYKKIRTCLLLYQQTEALNFSGEVELDESYFGGRHKGNVGRSTKSKIPVFGILKRDGKVYTQIVNDVKAKTLKTIIKQRIDQGSRLYSDSWKSYDGLVFDGYEHYRINHSYTFAENKRNHINGIESFWSYAKNKLTKYYGIKPEYFELYLKEYEFRFNHRNENLTKLIFKIYAKFNSK